MTSVTIELQDDVVGALRQSAELRRIPVEQVAAEVLSASMRDLDGLWSDEDRAAVEEGIVQLDRGEGIPHEQVVAEMRAKFRG